VKVAIVQYDNRSDQDLGAMGDLIKINADYAKKHGYSHTFDRAVYELPPYWIKVLIVLDALNQGFDIVLWIDSDAVVHDRERKIETFFEGDELFVYSSDCGTWPEVFNAGIFFVKQKGKYLIEEWKALYDENMWFKEPEYWRHCVGRWAGEAFEQGSFIDNIIPKHEKVLKKIDWRIIQTPYPIDESFIVHFAGQFRSNSGMYSHLHQMPPTKKLGTKPMSRRVAIVSPSYDSKIVCDHAIALVTIFQRAARERPDLNLSLNYWMGEALLQKARNNLFCDAYDSGVDDIVFLDVDQGFDAQAFFDVLDHPVDVVGITARMKTDDERYTHRPEDPKQHRWNQELKLLEVEYLATGFLRLSRKAMKALYDASEPYNDGKERRLICDVQIINGGMISEDIQIGKKLKEAGIQSYLDIRHTCSHFGVKKYEGDYQYKYAETILEGLMENHK